jgi:hypothetical protein
MAWRAVARVLLGFLTALAGHGAATSVLERADGHRAVGMWWWVLGFALLTLTFYGLYENPLPQRLSRRLKVKVVITGAASWLLGAAGVISLYGVAAGVHAFVGGASFHVRTFLLYVLSLAIFTLAFMYFRDDILIIHTRHLRRQRLEDRHPPISKESEAKRSRERGPRCIVGILSSVRKDQFPGSDYLPDYVPWSEPPDLDADLRALETSKQKGKPLWPWEMLLRALRPHANRLSDLILVCSQERVGIFPPSLPQAPSFVKLIRKYPEFSSIHISIFAEQGGERSTFPAEETGIETVRGFDFGNLDEMSSAITDLLKFLLFGGLGKRLRASDILIDFTGGTKPVSVVAAAVTSRGKIGAQYVDTGDLVPTTYDLVANPEASKA